MLNNIHTIMKSETNRESNSCDPRAYLNVIVCGREECRKVILKGEIIRKKPFEFRPCA